MIRTANKATWDIRANLLQVGKHKLAEDSLIRFEPQLPYLYLPKLYYKLFVVTLNKIFSESHIYGHTAGNVCNENTNICRFHEPCKSVTKREIDFGLRMYDETMDKYFIIDWDKMYISGEYFGGTENECYIPVFSHSHI